MAKIKQIDSIEILDSKGNPTIQTTVVLENGATGKAACPSGTSVGTYEAISLKDNDQNRYHGLGVLKAVDNIKNLIAPKIIGMEGEKQSEIDRAMIELDGTENKSKLGANALLSVSMAVAKASTQSANLPLFLYLREFVKKDNNNLKIPTPAFNIINGGLHAGNNLDFQEFLVIPASSKTYQESLQIGTTIYYLLRQKLKIENMDTLIGDEGGFSPKLPTNQDALSLLKQIINSTSYKYGFDVFLGLDTASNNFYRDKSYHLRDKPSSLSSSDLISFYKDLNNQFNFLYLEDPLHEDDWDNWQKLCSESKETIIVGDDLTVTNPYRLQMALNKKAITGIIIKPNQIGTVIEALAVVEVAKAAGIKITVSHRSGETNDDFIADFAVAVSADYVKFGAPARGERVAKYNRLLEIEKIIQNK